MRGWLVFGLSAGLAAAAAGLLLWTAQAEPLEALSLSEDGIGPLRLGQDFEHAQRLAFRVAPDSAYSGIGCSGLDEIRYDGQLGVHPVGVMAMASAGKIQQVEVTLYKPSQARSQDECLALREHFAAPFIEFFGPYEASWQLAKPVSRELLARTGPVTIMARWFAAGGSCYVSAHYELATGAGTALNPALVALAD